MKELYDFKKLTGELNEGQDIINPNDFGSHRNLQDTDHITNLTFLEQGLAEIYGDIAAHGKSDAHAKTAVGKAIKELVDMNAMPAIPEETDSDGAKAMWISHAKPRIVAHLRLMGEIM